MKRNNFSYEILTFPWRRGKNRIPQLREFAKQLMCISDNVGFKLSSRGWCYQLEGNLYQIKDEIFELDKSQFTRVQKLINECIKEGVLASDFLADEEARSFDCVNEPTQEAPSEFFLRHMTSLQYLEKWYEPDYWEGESVYIQMLVEKIDLKTLFHPICEAYHVPIATSKGWSSVKQRIEIGSRFKKAEERGLKPVLLVCGDHDPYGLKITSELRNNLADVSKATKWQPDNLIVDRFGLNYDFIQQYDLTWIDNLVSGSGKKPDKSNPIIKEYVEKYGERKVEANALVVMPDVARHLCKSAIEKYTGHEILEHFNAKEQEIKSDFDEIRDSIDLDYFIQQVTETLAWGCF